MQTAYQAGRTANDHPFLLRCMIEFSKQKKKKLFIVAIDFNGAFDRVKRSLLLKKLIIFGAGSLFAACLANMYEFSLCNILGKNHRPIKIMT